MVSHGFWACVGNAGGAMCFCACGVPLVLPQTLCSRCAEKFRMWESFRRARAVAERIIARCGVADFLDSQGIVVREDDPR